MIDTSSYYPEVNGPDGTPKEDSLNGTHSSLFGDDKNKSEKSSEEPEDRDEISPTPEHQENEKYQKESGVEKVISYFANFISWALVPLLMPVYGLIFVFGLSVLDVVPPRLRVTFTFIVAGICFVLPMLLIMLLKFLGVIEDVGLNGRKERLIPYLLTALCMGGTAWFMAERGAPLWLCMFFTGGAVASLINLVINLKWKISAHAAGIAGIIALLIRLEKDVAVEPRLFVWLLIVIGITGILGSARIWLGRHTVWQVLAGYAVGFCSVFFLMSI